MPIADWGYADSHVPTYKIQALDGAGCPQNSMPALIRHERFIMISELTAPRVMIDRDARVSPPGGSNRTVELELHHMTIDAASRRKQAGADHRRLDNPLTFSAPDR